MSCNLLIVYKSLLQVISLLFTSPFSEVCVRRNFIFDFNTVHSKFLVCNFAAKKRNIFSRAGLRQNVRSLNYKAKCLPGKCPVT